jgi:hypothetical protein
MYKLSDEDIESSKSEIYIICFDVWRMVFWFFSLMQYDANSHYLLSLCFGFSTLAFTLPESQVVILGGVDRLAKSDVIYAVYPDTTSFYQATVVKAPQRVSGGDSFVMVNFKDDGDEHGITHDKAVLMQHIMRVPYGAIQ